MSECGGGKGRFEDVEELREVLKVISEFIDKLPKLISELMEAIYATDIGEKLGKSIGEYYKKLKESGIPEEVAIRLTENYARESQTPMKILGELIARLSGSKSGSIIEELERVKREMEKSKSERNG